MTDIFLKLVVVAAIICVVTILVLCWKLTSDTRHGMIPFKWNYTENFFELPFEIGDSRHEWHRMFPNNFPILIKLKNGKKIPASFTYTKDLEYDILGRPLNSSEISSRFRFSYVYHNTKPLNIIAPNEEFINPKDIVSWKPLNMTWDKFIYIFCW